MGIVLEVPIERREFLLLAGAAAAGAGLARLHEREPGRRAVGRPRSWIIRRRAVADGQPARQREQPAG